MIKKFQKVLYKNKYWEVIDINKLYSDPKYWTLVLQRTYWNSKNTLTTKTVKAMAFEVSE